MFSASLFVSSLFLTSSALSFLDSDIGLPPTEKLDDNPSVLGPVSEIRIANNFIAPDGFNRSATLVNGMFPGPLITANKGDDFRLRVVNALTDTSMPLETSVHWHGIFQHKSNWADGTADVTQCPLRPQEAFVQRFNGRDQAGTYWYHSHYTAQYCDGLRGPLVIYDPEDPLADLYDVDDENTVITLSDWYHVPSPTLLNVVGRVLANSTLINGKGRYPGGPAAPLSVISVEQGLRYRFRLIGSSCDLIYNFTIDGHRMTIIEVDGTEVFPTETDSIPILPGQRYSVVVTADKPIGNYWIRSLGDLPGSTFANGQNMAILRYDGAPNVDPTSPPGPYEIPFDEGRLHPLFNEGVPGIPEIGKADVNLVLFPGINSKFLFTLNGTSWDPYPIPVLLQILSGARKPAELLPNGSIYTLPRNKVIEISFPDPSKAPGAPHPMHLHGHNFYVVRVAGSNDTNFVDPVVRDVVSIGRNAWDSVTIRFVTDNPGPWFLHCHIDWHLNHGFAAVLAEAPEETAEQESRVIPADWTRLCHPNLNWGQTRLGGLLGY